MFRIVQLSHDILTSRVLVGVQGPTPADYISVSCSLPDGPDGPPRDIEGLALTEAARLLAAAAQALRQRQPDGPAGTGRQTGPGTRFTCECCGEMAAGEA